VTSKEAGQLKVFYTLYAKSCYTFQTAVSLLVHDLWTRWSL